MTITGKEYDTCPYVKCKFCGKDFSGGATRIEKLQTAKYKAKFEAWDSDDSDSDESDDENDLKV